MATRRRPPLFVIETPPGVPEPVQAASLLLVALRRAKVASLADLCLAVANDPENRTWAEPGTPDRSLITGRIGLSDQQWELILSWGSVLEPIRYSGDARITLAVCPTCGRYAYVPTSGQTGAKCWLSVGCEGKPVRAKAAKATRIIEK
jgi:hypothetical protein